MGNSDSIDISGYGTILRKHIVAVLLIPILSIGAAIGFALQATPTYRASGSVYLSLHAGDTVSELVQGSNYVQTLVRSYSSIASMPIVLTPVIEELGLDMSASDLSKSVKTSAPLDTSIIKVEVTDTSPSRAADIANGITDQLAITAVDLAPGAGKNRENVTITTVDPAVRPQFASSPNKKLDAAIGLVLGLLLALAYVVIREVLDTRVRGEEDLESLASAPLLASIPLERALKKSPLAFHQNPFGPTAEAFRLLRTNLQFVSSTRELKSLVITSPSEGEGKSTVSISLAEAYAKANLKVLLIDADLRRPSLSESIGIEGSAGLTNVLAGTTDIEDVYQEFGSEGVTVVAAGQSPPNPSELLGSDRMKELLVDQHDKFDVVILDTAPLVPVTDGTVLAQHADAILVVVRAGRTKRQDLDRAITRLADAGLAPVGVVLNSVAHVRHGYASYEPKKSRRRLSQR